MKNRFQRTTTKIRTRIVTTFGRAKLVKTAGSRYELRGATDGELTAAKEWVSLFKHDALLCSVPMVHRRETSNSRWKVSSFGRSA